MNAVPTVAAARSAEPRGTPQLRTILLTDLVDSTALVERLGDGAAAELFRAHDRLVLRLQNDWRGRLIDRSDGLLLLFERPVDGLGFALDYARGLRELGAPHGADIKARAGLHVGEVLSWRNSDEAVRVGAKPVEVEGLAKPMAGRLMTMARPGQLLMSAVAEPLAHRAARELGERGQHLVWKSHGRWRFKGVPEPQQIFEVGEPGITPLRAPQPGPKAWRDIPLWRRPAALATELALLAALGFGIWFITKPQPAIAFNQRDWVVLADLRNLTGEPLLDDSLEQAFRISLEQSRHVNVLSDLKTRDTLARMQREPGTELDRAIASEIAIRDGARAVILPTVAEVGGRVRVSAEVIDPNSQTTVYAEYADGKGAVSALASIDEVTAALREKLGEALEAVERDSAPLPEVTTENLDALRSYALAERAYDEGKWDQASQLYRAAVELDPKFALAYMGVLRVHVARGEHADAQANLSRARELSDRLPDRDRLYLEAWSTEFDNAGSATPLEKWRMLSEMYPDYFAAQVNRGWAAFSIGKLAEASESVEAAIAPQNTRLRLALIQLGRIQLAENDHPAALRTFRRSGAGELPRSRHVAGAMAAARRFEEAKVILGQLPEQELTNSFEKIAVAIDEGDWREAEGILNRAVIAAKKQDPFLRDLFLIVDMGVRCLKEGDAVPAAEFVSLLNEALEGVGPTTPYASDRIYMALATAYLAQRAGHHEPVEHVLPTMKLLVDQVGDLRAVQMLGIVEAGQLRLAGQADQAVAKLQSLVDGGEPFQVHVALRDALFAAGKNDAALRENEWLSTHRGTAYGELSGAFVLQAVNVADTTLARLSSAEVALHSGSPATAQIQVKAFADAWPRATLPDHLRRRLDATLPASKQ